MGLKEVALAIAILAVIASFFWVLPDAIAYYCTPHVVYEGVVVDKYVKRYGDSDKFFVVIETGDGKRVVLQNTDTIFAWKFNSADIQASIEVGKKYRIEAYGWRIPFFSVFQNIVKVEPIS
jgi:hypothetical protein